MGEFGGTWGAVEGVVVHSPLRHCGCRIEQKLGAPRFRLPRFGTTGGDEILLLLGPKSGSSINLFMLPSDTELQFISIICCCGPPSRPWSTTSSALIEDLANSVLGGYRNSGKSVLTNLKECGDLYQLVYYFCLSDGNSDLGHCQDAS